MKDTWTTDPQVIELDRLLAMHRRVEYDREEILIFAMSHSRVIVRQPDAFNGPVYSYR